MAHHLSGREAHRRLVERLNRFPQGAPPSETLFKILSLLFSEREAALVAQLPIRHFTAAEAARRWGVSEADARETLEGLASRALLVDSQLDGDRCRGCGRCVAACPVEALSLVSAHDPSRPARKRASLDPRVCLGCGVCVQACRRGAIRLERRAVRVLTPLDTTHRVVLMALERGRLADLVFDRQTSGHRALAAVLGAILALPPVQRALASEQVRSRCLEALIESRRQRSS